MNFSTVTTKYQATIPEEIRILLGIEVGDKILYSNPDPQKKEAKIEVISTKNIVDQLYGSLHKPGMKYIPLKTVRKKAALIWAKKYRDNT